MSSSTGAGRSRSLILADLNAGGQMIYIVMAGEDPDADLSLAAS